MGGSPTRRAARASRRTRSPRWRRSWPRRGRSRCFVGPAGAGKSHTLAQLAQAWQVEHGGRVIATAAAEVATRNLRELGPSRGAGAAADGPVRDLAELGFQAVNIARLVTALEPDQHGRVRLTLQPNDLLVIDEAGMIDTRTWTS